MPNDRIGVLQDAHWSGGGFGYFPTYLLGTVLSVQIWEKAREAIPDVDEQIERGDFAELHEWLRENIYSLGRKLTPAETIERVVGGPITPQPYLAYLREKRDRAVTARYAARPKRFSARARARAASTSRSRGGAVVTSSRAVGCVDVSDLVDRPRESSLVRLRRLLRPADLADVLERRGTDLVLGRGRLEVVECLDVPAHAPEPSDASPRAAQLPGWSR